MPVILEPENVAPWLSGDGGADLLVPAAEEKLTSWPVSTHVNKAGGADEATLIDKVALHRGAWRECGLSIRRVARLKHRSFF